MDNSILTNPYPYTISGNSVAFTSDNQLSFLVLFSNKLPNVWEMKFGTANGILTPTGQGDQYKILSTVIASTIEWANINNPPIFFFVAYEKSLSTLYESIVSRVIPENYINISDNTNIVLNDPQINSSLEELRNYLKPSTAHGIFVLVNKKYV